MLITMLEMGAVDKISIEIQRVRCFDRAYRVIVLGFGILYSPYFMARPDVS